MLIFYITSYLNHRFTIPSILSEIDDPNLKPLEDDPRKVLINYRRIIIKDFISKNPLIEKEAVVAITIFIVLVLTTARLLGWLNIPDVFLYCTMFLIIISNEVTIYVWRHRRNKKLFALTLSRENRCMSETQEANSKVSGVSGIYRLLALMPIWAITFVLFIITDGVVYLSRDWLEGLSYQVAYSAHFGDAALLIAVLIVAAIIQRGPIIIPKTLRNSNTHWRVFIASVFAGAALCWVTWGFRSTQFADMYHDILIGPLILFFAITLLPVIYFNGSRFEKIATLFFISLWAVLIVYDVQSDRMDQRSWLQNHGFRLHN